MANNKSGRPFKYNKKPDPKKDCTNCSNCLPIGEGDHLCSEYNEIVLDDYEPTSDFMICKGKRWSS